MNERILVRIDFQNDFIHPKGSLSINNPDLIEKNQQFNNSLQKGMFAEIIDAADTHFAETYFNTKEAESFGVHTVYGTWGWNKAAEFKDNIPVTNIFKSSTNIWNEEKYYPILQQNWQGKNVYLCGLLSDVCVEQAFDGFLKRGANVTLFDDLCQGAQKQLPEIISDNKYRQHIERGQLRLMTTSQFFRRILNEKKQQFNLLRQGREM